MKTFFLQYITAVKIVLGENIKYKLGFVIGTVSIFLAYMFIPVWTTPGNSIEFQLSLLRIQDYILFFALSVVTALLTTMQIFLFVKNKKAKSRLETVGQSSVSFSSAIFGGLLATAACSSCIAAILGFMGAGTVFFVLDYQMYFVSAAFILVAVAIYYTARRVNGYCKDCEAKPKNIKSI